MYGDESVAGVQFDAELMATTDVDLLWDARATLKLALLDDAVPETGVLAILQKVDRSFGPLRKGDFQAVTKRRTDVSRQRASAFPGRGIRTLTATGMSQPRMPASCLQSPSRFASPPN